MKNPLLWCLSVWTCCFLFSPVLFGQPVVSNVRAQQGSGDQAGLVMITYDLASPAGPCTVTLRISADGGASFNVPAQTLSGAIGPRIAPGTDRLIVWDAQADWPGQYSPRMRFRVIADDGVVDAAPVITSSLEATAQVGVEFSYQITTSAPATLYAASNLPTGLQIDFSTGLISGTPQSARVVEVGLTAGNALGSDSRTLVLTIVPAVPVITSASSVTATQGVAFSHQISSTPAATRFEAVNLPPGLSLDTATGVISGVPSLAGNYTSVLRAVNDGGTGSQNWTLEVSLPPLPEITSASSVTGWVGTAFHYQISASNQPTGFNAAGLPAGLSLNASTGLISGTPETEGEYQVALTATNVTGAGPVFGLTIGIQSEDQLSDGMVLVEGGTLEMSMGTRTVESFYIGRYEVTWGEWQEVQAWGEANGYYWSSSAGRGCADDHPIHSVNWFDVLKWCNAKSEMQGLTPVYAVSGSVYRIGEPDHTTISQNLSANGYRLPLEAEWEFAARGGNQSNGYTYAGSNDLNAVGWYRDNSGGAACNMSSGRGTWPVGQKAANELGLHDMTGNVMEMCVDLGSSPFGVRVRGGSWSSPGPTNSIAYVFYGNYETLEMWYNFRGFRLAQTSLP